jgi:hypothetical protein
VPIEADIADVKTESLYSSKRRLHALLFVSDMSRVLMSDNACAVVREEKNWVLKLGID